MKVRLSGVRRLCVDGEFIRLDRLMKLASLVSTGGEAKVLIQGGEVFVDGEVCTMRGKKLRDGNVVRFGGDTLVVRTSAAT